MQGAFFLFCFVLCIFFLEKAYNIKEQSKKNLQLLSFHFSRKQCNSDGVKVSPVSHFESISFGFNC